jgi:hypothetical protein
MIGQSRSVVVMMARMMLRYRRASAVERGTLVKGTLKLNSGMPH